MIEMHYVVERYDCSVVVVYERVEQAVLDRKGWAAGHWDGHLGVSC